MSEHQYYEFRAVDRPLTKKQMDEVGEYSSRAEITPTSFTNEYNWGNFRGDEMKFIEKYFDAMVYTANWGTHRVIFRVPADLVDRAIVNLYSPGQDVEMSAKGDNIILDWTSQTEDYEDDSDSGDWMSGLISVRAEVLAGDLRPLYIAWLSAAQTRELDDNAMEPPIPPGLKKPTAGQIDLAAFLRVDDDLLTVAAAASEDIQTRSSEGDFGKWLTALPSLEKDEMLIALVANSDPFLPTRLRQRFQKRDGTSITSAAPRRTISQLLKAAEQLGVQRKAAEEEAAAARRAREQAQAARERAAHLERVAQRGDVPWNEVERLVESKSQGNYDSAVTMLKDLRDIALQKGVGALFAMRVHSLIDRHAKKTSFRDRVMKARIIPQSPGVA